MIVSEVRFSSNEVLSEGFSNLVNEFLGSKIFASGYIIASLDANSEILSHETSFNSFNN